MRPLLLLCCSLFALVIAASQAGASGVLIGWGDSPTNGAPTFQLFDCQSNSGESALVVSFVPPADIVGVTGFSVDLRVFNFVSGDTDHQVPLPAYWDLGAGGCRAGALSVAPGLQGDPLVAPSPVVDPWQGGLQLTLLHPWSLEAPGLGVFGLEGVLEPGSSVDLLAGHEYYIATFTLSHAKSVSSGACAGCCRGMVLSPMVQLYTGGSTQGGANLGGALWNPGGSCSGPVPARASTWGALKSVYR